MVLKDVVCTACGAIHDAMLGGEETSAELACPRCQRETPHETVCNGGCGKRYRFHDWSGVDFSGQVKLGEITAETRLPENEGGESVPVTNRAGQVLHEHPRFSSEARAERVERIGHARKVARGHAPIFMDLRRKQAHGR